MFLAFKGNADFLLFKQCAAVECKCYVYYKLIWNALFFENSIISNEKIEIPLGTQHILWQKTSFRLTSDDGIWVDQSSTTQIFQFFCDKSQMILFH